MSDDFPSDYRETLVTLEEPITVIDDDGSAMQSVFRCVEVDERDDIYVLFQPSISSERENDVVEVAKENVRGILYMDAGDSDGGT